MKKKIRDLTIEQLAEFYKLNCVSCPLNGIECADICVDAWEFLTGLKDTDEEVEV